MKKASLSRLSEGAVNPSFPFATPLTASEIKAKLLNIVDVGGYTFNPDLENGELSQPHQSYSSRIAPLEGIPALFDLAVKLLQEQSGDQNLKEIIRQICRQEIGNLLQAAIKSNIKVEIADIEKEEIGLSADKLYQVFNKTRGYYDEANYCKKISEAWRVVSAASPLDIQKAIDTFRKDFKAYMKDFSDLNIGPRRKKEVSYTLGVVYDSIDEILSKVEKDIKGENSFKVILEKCLPDLYKVREHFYARAKEIYKYSSEAENPPVRGKVASFLYSIGLDPDVVFKSIKKYGEENRKRVLENIPPPVVFFQRGLDKLLNTFSSAFFAASPVVFTDNEKEELNNIINKVRAFNLDYISWVQDKHPDQTVEEIKRYMNTVINNIENDIELEISKIKSFIGEGKLKDEKFVIKEWESWEIRIKEIKDSIKNNMQSEFRKISVADKTMVEEFNKFMEKNWLLKAATYVGFVILSNDDSAGKWRQLAKDIIDYRLDSFQKTSSSGITSELEISAFSRNPLGGIDFTNKAMRIGLEPMGSFAGLKLVLPEIVNVAVIDLDNEFKQIQLMASSGIRPSDNRILEFAAACYYRGEFGPRLGEITACLQQAHFLDERLGRESSPALRLATMLPEVL